MARPAERILVITGRRRAADILPYGIDNRCGIAMSEIDGGEKQRNEEKCHRRE